MKNTVSHQEIPQDSTLSAKNDKDFAVSVAILMGMFNSEIVDS